MSASKWQVEFFSSQPNQVQVGYYSIYPSQDTLIYSSPLGFFFFFSGFSELRGVGSDPKSPSSGFATAEHVNFVSLPSFPIQAKEFIKRAKAWRNKK